jgi:hypothetical protein
MSISEKNRQHYTTYYVLYTIYYLLYTVYLLLVHLVCGRGTFHANVYYTEAQSETVFLKESTRDHTIFFGFIILLDRCENNYKFLHYIDNTFKDIYEGPKNRSKSILLIDT